MSFIARIIASIFRALFGIVTLPLRLLGWEPKPTAAAVAEAAVEAVRADPIPAPAPPVPREPTPIADLVHAHVRKRVYTHESHDPHPLPDALTAWLDSLSDNALGNILGVSSRELQRHINAGLGGSTAKGPLNLPPVVAGAIPMRTKTGATGGTGGPSKGADLSAVLDELGLVFDMPAPRPR